MRQPKPGELFRVGRKLLMVCTDCRSIVQVNKPIIGSLHVCVEQPGQ